MCYISDYNFNFVEVGHKYTCIIIVRQHILVKPLKCLAKRKWPGNIEDIISLAGVINEQSSKKTPLPSQINGKSSKKYNTPRSIFNKIPIT